MVVINETPTGMGLSRFDGTLNQTGPKSFPCAFLAHPIGPDELIRLSPDSQEVVRIVGKFRSRYDNGQITMLDNMVKYLERDFLQGDPMGYLKVEKNSSVTELILLLIPYFSKRYLQLKYQEEILDKINQAISKAYEMGARIIGLGAYNSVITKSGLWLLKNNPLVKEDKITITSGNTLTAGATYQAALRACQFMNINPQNSVLTIFGATGSIGRVTSLMLARCFGKINIVARDTQELERLKKLLRNQAGKTLSEVEVISVPDRGKAVQNSEVIVFVTSATGGLEELGLEINSFKQGSVIVDTDRPRKIPQDLYRIRQDILAIEGGIYHFPNSPKVLGMGKDGIFACALETILKGLEGEFSNFGIGTIKEHEVDHILRLAKKYYFELAGFRMFDKPMSADLLDTIRSNTRIIRR